MAVICLKVKGRKIKVNCLEVNNPVPSNLAIGTNGALCFLGHSRGENQSGHIVKTDEKRVSSGAIIFVAVGIECKYQSVNITYKIDRKFLYTCVKTIFKSDE